MNLIGRKGTAVVIVTVLSLCLNLAFAGMMIGGRWQGWDHRGNPGGWLFRSVPEEARPLVEQALAAHQAEFDAKRKAVQDARLKVAALLKAEPMDRAQVEAAMAEMSQRFREMAQLGQQMLLDVTEKLTPEQRRQMAEHWSEDRFGKRR